MIGYYDSRRETFTYSDNVTTSTATTGGQWVTVSSTSCASNVAYEPPPYRRPKPPFVPFEPVRIPRYMAPPPPCPWPVALRRFRGDLV